MNIYKQNNFSPCSPKRFYFNSDSKTYTKDANPVQSHEFMAIVKEDAKDGKVLIEQRNKFVKGDVLEVLSPNECFNQKIVVDTLFDTKGNAVEVANKVQQELYLLTNLPLKKNDILRKKI